MADSSKQAPVGVLLFNLGGPDTTADVEPFLVNLFSDREIIELPGGPWLQPLFARLIAWNPHVEHTEATRRGILARVQVPNRQARAAGITNYRRTEALNSHPLFIEALATLVTRHLEAHP